MTRSAAVIASAVAVSAALVLVYAALGDGRYIPTPAADPCAGREWRSPHGLQAAIEQIALSGIAPRPRVLPAPLAVRP